MPQPRKHDPTPAEKAQTAAGIAASLERAHATVVETIEAVAHAHDARDVVAYAKARQSAERAVERIRDLAKGAIAHATDATDPRVREQLEQAAALADIASQNLTTAPSAPEPMAPTLRSESALLAALPPIESDGSAKVTFDTARQSTRSALLQLPFSDYEAFEKILAEFPTHELAVRFHKFKPQTQAELRAILKDPKNRFRARSIEASMPKLVAPPPAFVTPTAVTLVAPPAAFQSDSSHHAPQGADSASAFPGALSSLDINNAAPAGTPRDKVHDPNLAPDGPLSFPEPIIATGDHATAPQPSAPTQTATSVPTDKVQAPKNETDAPLAFPGAAPSFATDGAAPTPATTTTTTAAAPTAASASGDVRLDKRKEAERLHSLITMRDQAGVVGLLEANAHPERMYALMRAYPGRLSDDVRGAVTNKSLRARAFAYLGEQLSVDDRIRDRDHGDTADIMRDLDRLDDAHALALMEGNGNAVAGQGRLHWLPATTSFAAVQQALRDQLGDDDYYRAMHSLLAKADRAQAMRRAIPVHAASAGGPTVLDLDRAPIAVFGAPGLSPVQQARVELAEQRIRGADAGGDWLAHPTVSSPAYLALADLTTTERHALVQRLESKPLKNFGAASLLVLAREPDDATVIAKAVTQAQASTMIARAPSNEVGTDIALERAGDLLKHAHAKLDGLPKTAPAAERDAATREVARLEALFLADGAPMRHALAGERWVLGDVDGDKLAERLATIGADPIAIGAERLRSVSDGESLGRVLRRIPQDARLPALEQSGLFAQRDRWARLTPEQRAYITALVWEGGGAPTVVLPNVEKVEPKGISGTVIEAAKGAIDGAATTAAAPLAVPDEIMPPLAALGTYEPAREIALHDIVGAIDGGHVDRAFAQLARMSLADQQAIYDDPRYLRAYGKLPSDSYSKDLLIEMKVKGAAQVLSAHSNLATAREHPETALEALGHRTEKYGGQAALRRAYVVIEQLGGAEVVSRNPALIDTLTLTQDERLAIGRLVKVTHKNKTVDPSMLDARDSLASAADRETANQIMFGQPQLADSAEAALDPDVEAKFMFYRLREAAGVRTGPEAMDTFTSQGPALDGAVAEFMMLYQQLAPGGFSKQDLPRLAERYHRALRALDSYRAANDSFASSAAQIVGVVVGMVTVSVLSGGTLGPAALAAVSSLNAGAASAASGALIRLESTHGSIAKDFGTGAVEGAVAALSAPLAARVVKRFTAAGSAARGAARAGEQAVAHATGGFGARIATAAIDGGLSNMSGEIFQTAADEATWDRGIAEALATILASAGHGFAVGTAIGAGTVLGLEAVAVVGKFAAHVGEATAQKIARWVEGSGVGLTTLERLTEAEQRQLAEVYHLMSTGKIDEAEAAMARISSIPAPTRQMLIEYSRARVALDTVGELGAFEFEGMTLHPRVLHDDEFKQLAHGAGDAAVIIKEGQPHFIIRQGAPASAVREELTHLYQWQTDLTMRERMAKLSEEKFKHWDKVTPKEQLELHIAKLEVESNAKGLILDQLAGVEGAEAEVAVLDAIENLEHIEARLAELRAARTSGVIDARALKLHEPPRLYNKGATTPVKDPGTKEWADSEALIGKGVDDPAAKAELDRLGYYVERRDGDATKIRRKSSTKNDRPHLAVDEGTRTIKKGSGGERQNFRERAAAEGAGWDVRSADLASLETRLGNANSGMTAEERALGHLKLQKEAPEFRALLTHRIGQAGMDKASAGMLARWGRTLEAFAAKAEASGQRIGVAALADELLAGIPMPLTEAGYDLFRHRLRTKTVDFLHGIEDGTERMKTLHEMVAVQPDSSSKGHLFGEFSTRDMTATGTVTLQKETPKALTGTDLHMSTRRPDRAGSVSAKQAEGTGLPQGRNAIEDKTGPEAFRIKQAEDYAKRARPEGFVLTQTSTTKEYDNLVYVFSNQADATTAMRELGGNSLTNAVLGKTPGGIHVAYYNDDGMLNVLRVGAIGGVP